MKNLSIQKVIKFAKCSKSTAIELLYSDLHLTKKLYTNRGNNATATCYWLAKNFDVIFTHGNDAPRGGQRGNYVTFEPTEKFEKFAASLNDIEAQAGIEQEKIACEKYHAIEVMVISEIEKQKYLTKVQGLSNKQSRKEAHKFAAKKLGFFSTEGMKKFFELK